MNAWLKSANRLKSDSYFPSIIEASTSKQAPNISTKQTYWSCQEFEEELPSSSKPHRHIQKYSSASTVDLDEHQHQQAGEKCHFEQLVHKYNLYAYVQTDFTGFPPLPNYAESTQQSSGEDSVNTINTIGIGQEMSNIPSQPQYTENPSLEAVKKICGIPARLTGFFSLVTQTIVMLVALALTVFMFYELGGYNIMRSTMKNGTNSEKVIFPTPTMLEITNMLSNSSETESASIHLNDLDDWDNETSTFLLENSGNGGKNIVNGISGKNSTNQTLLQSIGPITLRLGKVEINVLSLIRCSCLLYIGLCVFWLISIVCLGMSLRYEVLDLVYINTLILAFALLYTLVQAILIGIIIFYQTKYNWPVLILVSGTVGSYLICFIFECFALTVLVVWYRYIDYITGSTEACMCTSTISRLIKSRRQRGRGRQAAAAEYTIPEATHHANLPYIDEPTVQHFSNF